MFSPAIFFADTPIIAVTDDGDAAPSSLTSGNSVHTYNAQTSTGPDTVLFITWRGVTGGCCDPDSVPTLSSVTWNGNAMSIKVSGSTNDINGAAIATIGGAQSGNVVLTFNGAASDSEISKASLANLQSHTAIDTDTAAPGTSNGIASLAALASPGTGGVRLVAYLCLADGTTIALTNATGLSDLDAGLYRHAAYYDLGDDSGTITGDGGAQPALAVGVSLR